MSVNEIISSEQYEVYNKLHSILMDKDELTENENHMFDMMTILLTQYENVHYPVKELDPIQCIKERLAEKGLIQNDLVNIIGSKALVSHVMTYKRRLTINMCRSVSQFLNLPIEVLVTDYELKD